MFVLKHALLNLGRNILNYVLVGIILFLLIWGTMVTTTLYSSAKLFAKNYSKQFTTLVTILEPGLSNLSHEEKLTKEQYIKFGESDYVNGIKMVGSVPVSFEKLKTIENTSPIELEKLKGDVIEMKLFQSMANLFGTEPANVVKELAKSHMEIHVGTSDLKLNECLISTEFAQLNQLQIGDSIQVMLRENEKTEKQILTIAGMYQPKRESKASGFSQLMMIQQNDVFTSWETLQTLETYNHLGYNNVSYELKNRDTFHEFVKEMHKNGLPSDYQVVTNETSMEILLNPVNGIGTMAGTILLGFLIFGNFSLASVSIWRFQKLQVEICVLRTSGITKKQLIKSRVIEWIMVTMISFTLAFLITRLTVEPIADWQLMNQQQLAGNLNQLFIAIYNDKTEVIRSIPMILNNLSLISILAITSLFLITIISIDSYKIFKFEPIEFLLERNVDE